MMSTVAQVVSLLFFLFVLQWKITETTYIRYRRCPKMFICTALSQCPRQSRMLHRAADFYTAMDHFGKHLCGLHDGMIEVCCHETYALLSIKTEEKSLLNDAPSFENDIDNMINTTIVRHPNLRLINQHECGVGIKNRAINGDKTIPGEFPWIALLQYQLGDGRLEFRCGGTLVSQHYVLTAAHCVRPDDFSKELVSVRLGEYDVMTTYDCTMNGVEDEEGVVVCASNLPRDYRIAQIIRHSGYKTVGDQTHHDIALVRLRSRARIEPHFIVPVCLPTKNLLATEESILSLRMVTAGWGVSETDNLPTSDVLLKTTLSHLNEDACATRLGIKLSLNHMCAVGNQMNTKCSQVDMGGPLMITLGNNLNTRIKYQVAIASQTHTCDLETPSVYTKVEPYIRWILDNMED